MKISSVKEKLKIYIDQIAESGVRNQDIPALNNFLKSLADPNYTDLSPDIAFNLAESAFNDKEDIDIFLKIKAVFKEKNMLTLDNLVDTFYVIDTNKQKAVEVYLNFITRYTKNLKVAKIVSLENKMAVLQNIYHGNSIITILWVLNKAKILNPKNRITLSQNTEYIVEIAKILDQLSYVEEIFNGNREYNQANFDAVCQIVQHPDYVNIKSSISYAITNAILNQRIFVAIYQNPQYAKDIVKWVINLKDMNVHNPETEAAICGNPQYAENIVDAFEILKMENLFSAENRAAIYRHAQYLRVINAAFIALVNAKKLTQQLVEDIFINFKDAMFIAEKNGGKPAGNPVVRDFCQIRILSRFFAQATRENNSSDSITKIGKIGYDMLKKVAIDSNETLDPSIADDIFRQSFN